MNKEQGKRIGDLIASMGYSKAEFARMLNERPQTVSNWVSRGAGEGVLNKIISVFSTVNISWIINGKGDMFLPNTETHDLDVKPIDTPIVLRVPLVSQYAQAGYLSGYADETYMSALPTMPYIVDHEAQGHYIAFEVKGDSMNDGTEDAILEGDRLLCREIAPHLWVANQLHFRKWDFVIVHKDGILVKRISDHDVENHTITIHSLNPLFPDKVIDLAEVRQIFNVIELQRPKRR